MQRIDVSKLEFLRIEPRGKAIFEKFWVDDNGVKKLVKVSENNDQDIMEYLTSIILKKLNIPCVDVELGIDGLSGKNCCLVTSFLNEADVSYDIYECEIIRDKDEDMLKTDHEHANEIMNSLNTLKETLKQQVDDMTNEIERIQHIGLEKEKAKQKLNSEITISEERMSNHKENYERYEKEIEEVKVRIKELEEEKQKKTEKKTSLFQNKEKFEKELAKKQEELEKITKTLSAKELEMEEKKQMIEKHTDEKYEAIGKIKELDVNFENFQKREKNIAFELKTNISELDATKITKEEIAKTFHETNQKRSMVANELEKISEERSKVSEVLKQYDEEIANLLMEARMKESRLTFLQETEREKEGYTKSVKSLLIECEKNKELSKGVYGGLSNIVLVEKQYQTAIEMALGGALQNIVTEKEEDAKKLVEHLRKYHLGRASFLPISSVKGKKLEKWMKTEGVIRNCF